jgi:xylulokinase
MRQVRTATSHIGVDVGTSGCKAVLVAAGRGVVHEASASYPTRHRVDGEVTQDPREWLRAVREVLRACAQAAGPHGVEGIGLTAPAHVGVLCDAAGDPLTRSLLAFDGRPAATARQLRDAHGAAFRDATYVELTAGWNLPQLVWLRGRRPELWPRIRWFLTQKDWIRFRMTGVALMDHSDAAGTAMLDQRRLDWFEPACREAGLAPEQLPPVVTSTTPGGVLSRAWARATGLRQGTPVVVGATDTAAELVSVGALEDGASLVKVASTGTVVGVSDRAVVDRRLLTYPHAIPGAWYTLGATSSAAVAYRWLGETAFGGSAALDPWTYPDLDRRAARIPPGSAGLLFLPFLQGERTPFWDSRLRGAFLGLTMGHSRDHLARAVLEGVAMGLRACLDAMVEAGMRVERPALTGGGLSSPLWRSIVVAALGRPARIVDPHGPAIGAATLAAAAGATTAAGVRQHAMPSSSRAVTPRAAWSETYDALYDVYRDAARETARTSHRLADLARD